MKLTHQKSVESSHEFELANEVALYTSMMESDPGKEKKSKLPWKRSKGRYTPSEEMDKVQQNMVQSLSRTSSWSSLYSANQKLDLEVYDHPANERIQNNLSASIMGQIRFNYIASFKKDKLDNDGDGKVDNSSEVLKINSSGIILTLQYNF